MSKWLAQCLGDADEYEVSVVKETYKLGRKSYGWEGEDKVIIAEGDSEGELSIDDTDDPTLVARWRAEEEAERKQRQKDLDAAMKRATLLANALTKEEV